MDIPVRVFASQSRGFSNLRDAGGFLLCFSKMSILISVQTCVLYLSLIDSDFMSGFIVLLSGRCYRKDGL